MSGSTNNVVAGFVLLGLAVLILAWGVLRGRRKAEHNRAEDSVTGAWAVAANEAQDSILDRVLMGPAKAIGSNDRLKKLAETDELGWLQRMLLAAGSPYGGSVEVFLSIQLAAALFGVGLAIFGRMMFTFIPTWLVAGLGAVMILMPYSRIYDSAKKRSARILKDLPDFVDLLLIPIVAGTGIKRALRETAERFESPVSTEVMNAMSMVDIGRPLSEALWFAGHRLAVPEGRVFFSALAQAEERGASVREMLERQRDSLRHEAHQRARAEIKKIPTKIVFVFGIHFMPVLFSVALVPLVAAFTEIG